MMLISFSPPLERLRRNKNLFSEAAMKLKTSIVKVAINATI
jgi:hypothetical protein